MSIYTDFWDAVEARDWDRFVATIAEDVVVTWPQTRETVRGRDDLVRFMRDFPGDWHLRVEDIHADGTGAATRIAFTMDGETDAGLTFFTPGPDGLIATLVEYWPSAYEPPANRAHLTERY